MLSTGDKSLPVPSPTCKPPLTKNGESALIFFDNSTNSSWFIFKANNSFIPFKTAVPLLEPPPKPALVGIFLTRLIFILEILGNFSFVVSNACIHVLFFLSNQSTFVSKIKSFDFSIDI